MKKSPRVETLLKKYAHIVGGTDAQGQKWPVLPENQLKQHLFYVKNESMEHGSGEFVFAHAIVPMIIDDLYSIDYVGLNKHTFEPKEGEELSKEHKATLAKFKRLCERQAKDVAEGTKSWKESQGIYTDEPVAP